MSKEKKKQKIKKIIKKSHRDIAEAAVNAKKAEDRASKAAIYAREARDSVIKAEERLKKAIDQLKKLGADKIAKKNSALKLAQKKGIKQAKKNKKKGKKSR